MKRITGEIVGGLMVAAGAAGFVYGSNRMFNEGVFDKSQICADIEYERANPTKCDTYEERLDVIDAEGDRTQNEINFAGDIAKYSPIVSGAGIIIAAGVRLYPIRRSN